MIRRLITLPELARSPMAQVPPARALMIDLPTNGHHLPDPIVTCAHGKPESVTGLPNRLAFNEHQAMEVWFFRLRRMVDTTSEAPIDHEASLAIRIHAPPTSCTGAVPSAALRFSSAEDTCRVANGGSDSIPGEEKIKQGVKQMLAALLGVARPDIQGALRIGSRYGKFSRASVSPVKAVDEGSCHLRIEFKIEVAHGGCSVRSVRQSAKMSIRSGRRCLDAHRRAWQLVIEECLMCFP